MKKKSDSRQASHPSKVRADDKASLLTGLAAPISRLIEGCGPIYAVTLQRDYGYTQTCARLSELRGMGFNIQTQIHEAVHFPDYVRHNCASYSMGFPRWQPPGKNND